MVAEVVAGFVANSLALLSDAEQQHGVGEGGEDLQAVEPEGPVGALAGRGELDRGQRQAEAEDVGEHVPGVGQQGERPGGEAGHHLHHHEHGEQDEGGGEPPPVALAGAHPAVVVAVVVAHALAC
jgi:hypothetical protein